jgi:hypothetical protein
VIFRLKAEDPNPVEARAMGPFVKRAPSTAVALSLAALCACGGGSGSPPTTPTPPTPAPTADTCRALGQTAITNGIECSAGSSAVVLLNFRATDGAVVGSCSGTIIAPRAILTAAHCLDGETAVVRVWLGSGDEIVASSFVGHPNYSASNTTSLDVGVVVMAQDLPRTPIPLLTSRDARVGESAVVAGWGRDLASVGATLRAGTTAISAVGPSVLQTEFSSQASGICQGDSGGPILLSEGGVWSIAGITSASTVVTCNAGTQFFAAIRNAAISSFVLQHVPGVGQR